MAALCVVASCAPALKPPPPPVALDAPVAVRTASQTTVVGEQPQLFATGAISTELPEFSITLSADMRTAYYNRMTADRRGLMLLRSVRTNNGWTQGENVFSDIYRNVDPFLTANGKRLYYSSTRPTSATDTAADFNTWYVDWEGTDWGEPRTLGSRVDTDSSEVFVSADKNGTLYFSSNRSGKSRIYSSKRIGSAFAPAELVDFAGNSAEGGGNPGINPEGNVLVYVSGTTGPDLYVTCRRGSRWTPPVALGGGVNTGAADFAPSFSTDGRTFFFTSERSGLGPIPNVGERPAGDIYYLSAAGVRAQCGS